MDLRDLDHVCCVGSVRSSSYEHGCLSGICMIQPFHTCFHYWDVYDLDLSTGLLGCHGICVICTCLLSGICRVCEIYIIFSCWDMYDIDLTHMFRQVGSA